MEKCELRKLMIKYMRYLEELKEIHIFTHAEKIRQKKDMIILKNKIKSIREELER